MCGAFSPCRVAPPPYVGVMRIYGVVAVMWGFFSGILVLGSPSFWTNLCVFSVADEK